jgi:5-methylcytosine-specific restriction endonuclease McrA
MIRSGVPGKLGVIRLKGPALAALRRARFILDRWKCVDCGRPVSWASGHLSHLVSRGAGGSDVIENVRTKCGDCHLVGSHNPKSVPIAR